MFIGGILTESRWMREHSGKALMGDTLIAVTAFVGGMLMLTHVIPGAVFGAIPASLGFTLLVACAVVGALSLIRQEHSNSGNYHISTKTLKERNKEYKERFDKINKGAADVAETKKLLEDTKQKLGSELTPAEKSDLEALKRQLESELGIKKD